MDLLCDLDVLGEIIAAMEHGTHGTHGTQGTPHQPITASLCSLAAVVLGAICGGDSLRPGVLILRPEAAVTDRADCAAPTARRAAQRAAERRPSGASASSAERTPKLTLDVVAADLFDGTVLLREAESGAASIVAKSVLESNAPSLVGAGSRISFLKPAQAMPLFLPQSSVPKAPTPVESTVERVRLSGALLVLADDATKVEKRPTNIQVHARARVRARAQAHTYTHQHAQVLTTRTMKSSVALSLRSGVACQLLSAILRASERNADGAARGSEVHTHARWLLRAHSHVCLRA